MKLPSLHTITLKLIIAATLLHKQALLRKRRALHAQWKRSMDTLTALSNARVQAQKRVNAASLAVSEFDDELHRGVDVYINLSKQ